MSADATGHEPALLVEVLAGLSVHSGGCYIDCTFGCGGHSEAILALLGASGRLMALDRDPAARKAAQRLLEDKRFKFESARFSELAKLVAVLFSSYFFVRFQVGKPNRSEAFTYCAILGSIL